MQIKHILVPLDFSSDSARALDCAIELAQKFQAQLTLLHVIHIPVMTEANIASIYNDMEAGAQREMETHEKTATDAGLTVATRILQGMPFQEIIDTAEAQQVDLIVMGTHGRTGLRHLMIGSVAERVVRLAPCPVMVTREREP